MANRKSTFDSIKRLIDVTLENRLSDARDAEVTSGGFFLDSSVAGGYSSNVLLNEALLSLSNAVPNTIKGKGGSILATHPVSSSVLVRGFQYGGGAVGGGKLHTFSGTVTLDFSPYLADPANKRVAQRGTYFIQLSDNVVKIVPQSVDPTMGLLGKVVIPSTNATVIGDDDLAFRWYSEEEDVLYGDVAEGFIVSARDPFFMSGAGIDDDDTLKTIYYATQELDARGLFGNINISDGLTLTNLSGSMELTVDKMQFKNIDGEVLAEYGATQAYVGNILITPTSLESRNYETGVTGFKISDTGDVEFNNATFRGYVYAEGGWFGGVDGWAIGSGAILSASATNYSIGLVTEAMAGFDDRMIFIRGSSGSGLPSYGDEGIQLYHDISLGISKFYAGDGNNKYFEWDGTEVEVQGVIKATTGWFGGENGWAVGAGLIASASTSNYSIGMATEALPGFNDRMIFIRGNDSNGLPNFGDAGIQLYHDRTLNISKMYCGDGANNYFEWDGSATKYEGWINATGGWFGGITGWAIGPGAILSASATAFSIGLVTEGMAGFSDRMIFIRGNSSSGLPSFGDAGIQLYHDVAGGISKFYVGDGDTNYFSFTGGSTVEHQGVVKAKTGWFGGQGGWAISTGAILSASATSFSIGLVTETMGGFDDRMIFIRGNSSSGLPSFGDQGIQLYHDISAGEVKFHLGDDYATGTSYLHYTESGGLEIAGSVTITEVGKWYIDGDVLEARDAGDVPIMALVSDGNDATPNPLIWIKSSTFGNQGIQIEYNNGTPRFYAGNGSTSYVQFSGSALTFQASNTTLDSSGNLTVGGDFTANAGYIGGSSDGWIITTGKLTSSDGDIVLDSIGNKIDIGQPNTAGQDGLRLQDVGMQLFHSGTLKGEWQVDSEWWLGESTTNRKVYWNPDTNSFIVKGNAEFDVLVWHEVMTTRGELMVAKSGGQLYEDVTVNGTIFNIKVSKPNSLGAPFESNDRCRIKQGTTETWFTVGSPTDAGDYFQYSCAYQSGSSSATYTESAPIVDYGISGDGWLEMVADPSGSEDIRYSVKTHSGSPWSDEVERLRIGNLYGYLGIATDLYGFAAGSSAGSNANIIIDPSNGIRIRQGTTNKMTVDNSGNVNITGTFSITSGSSGIGNFSDAGPLVDADDLDDIPNGSTYSKTTANQVTGAGRAYSALNSSNNLVTAMYPSVSIGSDPGASGLYAGADYFGFFDNSTNEWRVAIKADGTFLFKGDSTNYVEWTGSALNVRGALNAEDITAGILTGRFIRTAETGARVEMGYDSVYGLRAYNASNEITFQVRLSGTYEGDVIIGNPEAGSEGHIWWDNSASRMIIRGKLNAEDLEVGSLTAISYETGSTGARVTILEDANSAINIYDGDGNKVFRSFLDGTYVGDIIIGNPSAGATEGYIWWDYSASRLLVRGELIADDITSGGTITGNTFQTANANQRIVLSQSNNRFSMFNNTGEVISMDTDFDHFFSNMGAFSTYPGIGLKAQGTRPAIYMAGDDTYKPFISLYNDEDFSNIKDFTKVDEDSVSFYRNATAVTAITAGLYPGFVMKAQQQDTSSPVARTVLLPIDGDNDWNGYIPVAKDGTDREPCIDIDKQTCRGKVIRFKYSTNYMITYDLLTIPANCMITNIRVQVQTAYNNISETIDIGYNLVTGTDDLDYFANNVSLNSVGWPNLANYRWTTPTNSAATIQLSFARNGTPTAGEFLVWIEYTEVSETYD